MRGWAQITIGWQEVSAGKGMEWQKGRHEVVRG